MHLSYIDPELSGIPKMISAVCPEGMCARFCTMLLLSVSANKIYCLHASCLKIPVYSLRSNLKPETFVLNMLNKCALFIN